MDDKIKVFKCRRRYSFGKKEEVNPRFIKATSLKEAEKIWIKDCGTMFESISVKEDKVTKKLRLFKLSYYYHDDEGAGYGCDGHAFYKYGYVQAHSESEACDIGRKKVENHNPHLWVEYSEEIEDTTKDNLIKILLSV